MSDSDEPAPEPRPEPKTESSGDGAGRPPRKTALGYAGFDDDDKEKQEREAAKRHREHLRNQASKQRYGPMEESMESERTEFLRRWREKYPIPAGSKSGSQK